MFVTSNICSIECFKAKLFTCLNLTYSAFQMHCQLFSSHLRQPGTHSKTSCVYVLRKKGGGKKSVLCSREDEANICPEMEILSEGKNLS